MVEQLTCNQQVPSSTLGGGTNFTPRKSNSTSVYFFLDQQVHSLEVATFSGGTNFPPRKSNSTSVYFLLDQQVHSLEVATFGGGTNFSPRLY